MIIDIIEKPIRFHLHGISGIVENERYGEVGMRLMNQMWPVVKGAKIPNAGINHWVYLAAGKKLFVGIELLDPRPAAIPAPLELLEFESPRYLEHLHIGPYQLLPQKWKALQAEIAARGERMAGSALEIYGHHCEEPSKLETTILIGLQARPE